MGLGIVRDAEWAAELAAYTSAHRGPRPRVKEDFEVYAVTPHSLTGSGGGSWSGSAYDGYARPVKKTTPERYAQAEFNTITGKWVRPEREAAAAAEEAKALQRSAARSRITAHSGTVAAEGFDLVSNLPLDESARLLRRTTHAPSLKKMAISVPTQVPHPHLKRGSRSDQSRYAFNVITGSLPRDRPENDTRRTVTEEETARPKIRPIAPPSRAPPAHRIHGVERIAPGKCAPLPPSYNILSGADFAPRSFLSSRFQ